MTSKRPKYVADNGSTFPAPENIINERDLSITINPVDQYLSDKNRFKIITSDVYKILKFTGLKSIKLWPELSSKGRLHFHGCCRIKDIGSFYMFQLHDLIKIGHIKMDTIGQTPTKDGSEEEEDYGCDRETYEEHRKIWFEYCTKGTIYMKQFTETNGMYDKNGCMEIEKIII